MYYIDVNYTDTFIAFADKLQHYYHHKSFNLKALIVRNLNCAPGRQVASIGIGSKLQQPKSRAPVHALIERNPTCAPARSSGL